jgi:hypothetical protein
MRLAGSLAGTPPGAAAEEGLPGRVHELEGEPGKVAPPTRREDEERRRRRSPGVQVERGGEGQVLRRLAEPPGHEQGPARVAGGERGVHVEVAPDAHDPPLRGEPVEPGVEGRPGAFTRRRVRLVAGEDGPSAFREPFEESIMSILI